MRKIKYIFLIVSFLTICFSFFFYKKKKENKDDILLIVDRFNISIKEFNRHLLPHQDEIILLDNYINYGIFVKTAKDNSILLNREVKKQLCSSELALIAKYSKLLRTEIYNVSDINIAKSYERFNGRKLIIDYAWIPKEFNDISDKIYDLFNSGISYDEIKKDPEYVKWSNKGVILSENIIIEAGSVASEIENTVCKLKNKEVKQLQTKSGFHVIKLIDDFPSKMNLSEEQDNIKQRIAFVNQIEEGDTILNENYLNGKIYLNNKVLSSILFFDLLETDDIDIFAAYKGSKIYYKDINALIENLPQNIKSLFQNKSTVGKATAALILLRHNFNYQNYGADKLQQYKESLQVEAYIKHQLKGALTKDTSNIISHIFQEAINQKSSNNLFHLLAERSSNYNDTSIKRKCNDLKIRLSEYFDNKIGTKPEDYLEPQHYENSQFLKINYRNWNKRFRQKESVSENQIIASAPNFHLTVRDFMEVLDRLSPETRLTLINEENVVKLINYVSGMKTSSKNLIINRKILKEINIIGESYDKINAVYSEDEVVGALFGIKISIKDLRKLVNEMPEDEKGKFKIASNREQAFKELLMRQFWLSKGNSNQIKNLKGFKIEFEKLKNRIITEALYNDSIYIDPVKTHDERLNYFIRFTCKEMSNKVLEHMFEKLQTLDIRINKKMLEKLNIDINKSKYAKFIKLY